MKQTNQ